MKHVNHWAGRLSVILLAALILGGTVSCKKDDDKDDPQPSASAREQLVGGGNKRWYYKQEGTVKLPLTASASEVANASVTLKDYLACEQDDAILFYSNGKMAYWQGQVGCEATDPTNVLEDMNSIWSLVENDSKIELKDSSGSQSYFQQIKQLSSNRLHMRYVETQSDGIYVFEDVFESR